MPNDQISNVICNSASFVSLHGCLAIAALGYSFYKLWKISQKEDDNIWSLGSFSLAIFLALLSTHITLKMMNIGNYILWGGIFYLFVGTVLICAKGTHIAFPRKMPISSVNLFLSTFFAFYLTLYTLSETLLKDDNASISCEENNKKSTSIYDKNKIDVPRVKIPLTPTSQPLQGKVNKNAEQH